MEIRDYVDYPFVCKKIRSFKDHDLFLVKKKDQWIRIFQHRETLEHIILKADMHKVLGFDSYEEMINSDRFLDFINSQKKESGKMPFILKDFILKENSHATE